MAEQIINAAPLIISRGTQDKSTRTLPVEAEAIPTHLPKYFVWAEKGPLDPQLVVGGSRNQVFGDATWDLTSKYANHSTVFANAFNAAGNSCMVERIIAPDAGPEANMLLSVDVLETTIPTYKRLPNGDYLLTPGGQPEVDATAPPKTGYSIAFIVSNINTVADMYGAPGNPAALPPVLPTVAKYGAQGVTTGTRTDPISGDPSMVYPLLEMKASSLGEWANFVGVHLFAPDANTANPISTKLLTNVGAYPYRLEAIRKSRASGTTSVRDNTFGERVTNFTLKPDARDPSTGARLHITDVFPDLYENLTDPRYPKVYGDVGHIHVYQGNIDTLLEMFTISEATWIGTQTPDRRVRSDLTGTSGSTTEVGNAKYLFNLFGGKTSHAMPYETVQIETSGANVVSMSPSTDLLLAGASDGTMNDVVFAQLVVDKMQAYQDPNNFVMETAYHVESVFYDSGYPITTKFALLNAIAVRKDTFVFLTTHDATRVNGVAPVANTASEESSIATLLRATVDLFPESDYFGTPVMRALVMKNSGKIRGSVWNQETGLLYEIAKKNALYMGAGNGIWKSGFSIDGAPNSIIDSMYDLNAKWTPVTVRNKDWDLGLNWAQYYDRSSFFIPALKTVYTNDTSVLNNMYTALAICELNKVHQRVWRQFSGVSNLTNGQLANRVDEAISTKAAASRFDNKYVIQPTTSYTEGDIARGYSWSTVSKIFANSMKTVMTSSIQAWRMSDYEGGQ